MLNKGSVIVDVAIDQGSCGEPWRPATHAPPTSPVHGVLHCYVANLLGAVAATPTLAIADQTVADIQKGQYAPPEFALACKETSR